MEDLAKHRIPGTCEAFYIPDFLTEDDESYLIRKITETPRQKWKQLLNRRLQVLGGDITSKSVLVAQGMPSFIKGYPDIIGRLREMGVFKSSPHGEPNHVILNEYLPGQGIMPHEDGPSYYPLVATISLGSHAVFHYYQYAQGSTATSEGQVIDSTPVHSVFLEPRSLIITTASLYTSNLHGIREIEEDEFAPIEEGGHLLLADLRVPISNWDLVTANSKKTVIEGGGRLRRGVRYSLTCRDVERVASPMAIGGR